ncbi:hypothetical protein [Schlesneria sp. T3-172]|uniref:hypothetical protein n=1 Tax=Schlesneria sphaerica TaxID=3373610 RepID=UPI0037C7A7CE
MSQQRDEPDVMSDLDAGRWVPRSHGNWFQAVRHKRDRLRTEEVHPGKVATLAQCQDLCRTLNKRKKGKS